MSPPATPTTPVSPPPAAPALAPPSPSAAKRKPSRRANTAERRATHNAVERQRRETLNGRFLDLAALLPNLSQIRRPSKSSIVNSSIAHIHASRRHRLIASRELRLLKLEADTLRRELNDWRERSGIPRIDEPARGEAFSMIISAELEVIVAVPGPNDQDDDDDEPLSAAGNPSYGGYVGGDGSLPDDDYMDVVPGPSPTAPPHSAPPGAPLDDPRVLAMLKHHPNPFAQSIPSGLPHILPRPPPANGPTNVPAFDALYEHYPQQALPHHAQNLQQQQPPHAAYLHQQQQQQQHAMRERDYHILSREREREMHIRERMQQEKMWSVYGGDPSRSSSSGSGGGGGRPFSGQWGAQGPPPMVMQAQRSLFTPPATSHGLPTPSPTGTHADAHSAGSPASSGDESGGAEQRARSGSRSSRGSHSPSYELGVGAGVGMLAGMGAEFMTPAMGVGVLGEYHGHGHGHGHGGASGHGHGHGHGPAGVPRMGGMLGMEMGMLGVGVEMH